MHKEKLKKVDCNQPSNVIIYKDEVLLDFYK